MLKFLRKNSRTILIITVLAFLTTVPITYYFGARFSSGREAKKGKTIQITQLAKVNGEPINLKRFLWLTNQNIWSQTKFGQPVGQIGLLESQYKILTDLIDYTLILQDAKKNKIKISSSEINKLLENLKFGRNLKSNQQLDLFLKRELGISLKDYRELIKEDLLAQKMAEKIKGQVSREKDEPESVFIKRQFVFFDNWLKDLKTKAKVEITYPYLLALELFNNQKLDEALSVCQKILKDNPSDLYARLFLGRIYLKKDQPVLALEELKKAANLNESYSEWRDPEVYLWLAAGFLKSGQKNEAKAALDKAALIAGDSLAIHQNLYLSYIQIGASKEAEKENQEITRIRQKIFAILKAYQEKEALTTKIKKENSTYKTSDDNRGSP